ncbi:hypothetical protein F441_10005 [Phytophthora nicotianae CJ01A1]|uniref:Uncharacterized protein n=5 Tax=Phytophthora nicotianae TaxID=4792 RepID=V9F4Q9_PHYNI|nr:hypothetical protein F443_10062 [Phytophthora nicotianae P1569]ETK85302.1 hypothetical protein L915_09856 [Phytophthora nicotianae]ETO73974.1 hypothetical protein F444_10160 [Phytophthora nicotianae P1976]ETP15148.1 hypothetical protein F441_10005 [Phytophthora nicotianae CJ01A1]ETP43203.1 hypothetical protein F442_09970 [Phytophthora nicotianae P10297]
MLNDKLWCQLDTLRITVLCGATYFVDALKLEVSTTTNPPHSASQYPIFGGHCSDLLIARAIAVFEEALLTLEYK